MDCKVVSCSIWWFNIAELVPTDNSENIYWFNLKQFALFYKEMWFFKINTHKIFLLQKQGKRLDARPKRRCKNNVKWILKQYDIEWSGLIRLNIWNFWQNERRPAYQGLCPTDIVRFMAPFSYVFQVHDASNCTIRTPFITHKQIKGRTSFRPQT